MKHKSYIDIKMRCLVPLVGGLLLLLPTSCKKFLDVDFPKQLTKSELVFTSDVTAKSAIYGIYSTLYTPGTFSDGTYKSLTALTSLSADDLTGDAQTDAAIVQFSANTLQGDNIYVLELWKSMYKVIYQANAVIEGLEASTQVTPAAKKQYMGEALFLRAFCNFQLVNLFGKVPLVLTTDYNFNSKISRSTVDAVYAQIKADLLAAQDLLAEDYVKKDMFTPAERIRANKFTATALLARVYLYNGEWTNAEAQAGSIIGNTTLYELDQSPDLSGIFVAGSREAIWQIKPFDGQPFTNEGYFYSQKQVTLFSNLMSPGLMGAFEETPVTDARKTNWITTETGETESQNRPFKYKNFDYTAFTMEYCMVFRLAEQYLIRAEARAQLGRNGGARDDINAIRNRAGLDNTAADSKPDLMAAIEKERRVELFTEWGHRWFDLKRWNRAVTVLGAVKPGFTEADELYPIPASELAKNPNLDK